MEEKRKYNIYKTIMIIVLTAFITFIITALVGYNYVTKGDGAKLLVRETSSNQDLIVQLEKYKSIIDEFYLGEVNEEDLKEGAIKGYIEGLGDPYTEYISKEEMKEYMEDTLGNYVGIGIYMLLDEENGKIKVLAPMKGSPAETVGIKSGDIIETVDGEEYTKDEMSEVANKIKGKEGTTVKIGIKRGEENLEFEVTRQNIKVNPVEGKILENNIGYIYCESFSNGIGDGNLDQTLNQLAICDGLIVDVRDNGGGNLTTAQRLAARFTNEKVLVGYMCHKTGPGHSDFSTPKPVYINPSNGIRWQKKVVVLTNRSSAIA